MNVGQSTKGLGLYQSGTWNGSNYWQIGAISRTSSYLRDFYISDQQRVIYTSSGNIYYCLKSGGGTTTNSNIAAKFTLYELQEADDIRYSYTITNTKNSTPVENPKYSLEHKKTIDAFRDNENNPDTTLDDNAENRTDLYRLYLDLKAGMIGAPLDMVLVLDNSNSMQTEDMDGAKRAEVVVEQAEWLATKVLDSDSRNNISVVGYSGSYWGTAGEDGLTNDSLFSSGIEDAWSKSEWSDDYATLQKNDFEPLLEDVLKKNGISSPSGSGTNIMQALKKAGELLDESEAQRPDSHRYVVFISDGYPTYYYLSNNTEKVEYYYSGYYGWRWGYFQGEKAFNFNPSNYKLMDGGKSNDFYDGQYRGRFGTGQSSSGDYATPPTIEYAQAIHNEHSDTVFYSLGVGSKKDTESPLMENTLKKIATNDNNYFVANDTKSLENAFHTILYGNPVSNVSVTDYLSQYVEWYGAQPDVLVTMEDKDGNIDRLWEGSGTRGTIGFELPDNRVKQSDGKEISIIHDVTYTPTPDSNGTTGVVQVVFNPEYELDVECKYTLSFNVKTTPTAYEEYASNRREDNNGYGDVEGDLGTDYGNNKTSSQMPGFHSNQSADVSYVTDGETHKELYDHPVIQVVACGLRIKKVDMLAQEKTLAGAEFDLYRDAGPEQGAVSVPGLDNVYGIKMNTEPLQTDETGEITRLNMVPGTYFLVETRAPSGYQLLETPVQFNLKQDGVDVIGDGSQQSMVGIITPGADGIPILVIKNSNGFTMPDTGGTGTFLYTGTGMLLMLSAALYYMKKRSIGRRGEIPSSGR
ncbi:MAG: VWA domain-containing protein [Clostridiales bacterium]|nr:VWA domain-containing protein [Clostridiales bacterium]